DDRRADTDHAVQLADVGVVHAEAAMRDEPPDRLRAIGAVDGVSAVVERQRKLTHRIVRRAAGDDGGQTRIFLADVGGRRPGRSYIFTGDSRGAGPGLAGLADADREAQRVAAVEHKVELSLRGLHNDRPRRKAGQRHDVAG